MASIPTGVPDEARLEAELAAPTDAEREALRALEGDLLILGAGGKMGPSLARLACFGSRDAGVRRRVIAVARFSTPGLREALEREGVETIAADLFDREVLGSLPEAPNVVYMAGQKFGTTGQEARTWAVNALLPGLVAQRFARSRIVAFSTGNVYPLTPVEEPGPDETSAVGPVGEYAQSALARERVLTFLAERQGTPMALLRLNYAIEPRYGVLRDIADRVWWGRPVELAMGWVNVIWQRDANGIALRALLHCAVPPLVLNVTGRPAYAVRWIAEQFGARWGRSPQFVGAEGESALLSNAARMEELFGRPGVGVEEMIERVAWWVERGGRSLGKPTHFDQRDGRF